MLRRWCTTCGSGFMLQDNEVLTKCPAHRPGAAKSPKSKARSNSKSPKSKARSKSKPTRDPAPAP